MNHLPLIKKIAKTKKPMIISTGTASINEIDEAYEVAKKNGCPDITLLYCVSSYPAKPEDFNLNNIQLMKNRFKCRIGLSDHSVGNQIAKLAVAAGADVIEKHIKLPNQKKGFDVKFSADRHEIKKLIRTGMEIPMNDFLDLEHDLQLETFEHPDGLEGAMSFLEKRKPDFK